MLKRINKFSKLAFVFTIFYILIGKLMMSNMYDVYMSADWIPKFVYKNLPLSQILNIPHYLSWITMTVHLGFMVVAITMGILGVIQANKTQEKGKWIILSLTLINVLVFVLNIIAIVIFPRTF